MLYVVFKDGLPVAHFDSAAMAENFGGDFVQEVTIFEEEKI